MGREKGTLNISANFEPQIAAPFDSRIVVDTYADLTAEDTFISTDGNNYAYVGMIVSVVADTDSNNNGIYLLKALPTTSAENWAGVGKGFSGITPEYSDSVGYEVGDIIVYISPYAELLEDGDPLKEEGLYECTADTEAGENPETAPNKWRYLGKLGETAGGTTITQIPGLQMELEDRVKYSDIGNNLTVATNKQVNLDVTYLTVTGYSPAEDIQPSPADPTDPTNPTGEVKIGNTIWKTANEAWTDGGPGIYPPNGDVNNVPEYGWLYTYPAFSRLLAANPGYRIPTFADWDSLRDFVDPLTEYSPRYAMNAGKLTDPNPIYWNSSEIVATNELQLSLLPAGYRYSEFSYVEEGYKNFKDSGWWWQDQGEDKTNRYIFCNLIIASSTKLPLLQVQPEHVQMMTGRLMLNSAFAIRLVKDI